LGAFWTLYAYFQAPPVQGVTGGKAVILLLHAFYAAVFFSLFDTIKLDWTTIGATLSFTGYIGVPFVWAALPVSESPGTAR